MGGHITEHNGIKGASFAVWAPNAEAVSVVGDFNGWDGRRHPLCNRNYSGIWDIFIPGIEAGSHYKFEVKSKNGDVPALKADPYGQASEVRPEHSFHLD